MWWVLINVVMSWMSVVGQMNVVAFDLCWMRCVTY